MSGVPGMDAEAAAIHAAFAEPVRYTGAGVTDAPIAAVRSDDAAAAFQGPGMSARQKWFEIRYADLPNRPANGEQLVDANGAGASFRVIEVEDHDDIDAWWVFVEAGA